MANPKKNGNGDEALNSDNLLEKFPGLAETLKMAESDEWKVVEGPRKMWAHASRVPAIGFVTGIQRDLKRKGEIDPAKQFFDAAIMRLTKPTLVQDDEGTTHMEVRGDAKGVSMADAGDNIMVVITKGLECLREIAELADNPEAGVLPLIKVSVTGIRNLDKNRKFYECTVEMTGATVPKQEVSGLTNILAALKSASAKPELSA